MFELVSTAKGILGILVVLAAAVYFVVWTVRYMHGHLTGRVMHLEGDQHSAYRWQLKGYKDERAGDLQAAADAYGESLRIDPTNEELAARRARLLEVIANQDSYGEPHSY